MSRAKHMFRGLFEKLKNQREAAKNSFLFGRSRG
jgi:hypothetical protein